MSVCPGLTLHGAKYLCPVVPLFLSSPHFRPTEAGSHTLLCMCGFRYFLFTVCSFHFFSVFFRNLLGKWACRNAHTTWINMLNVRMKFHRFEPFCTPSERWVPRPKNAAEAASRPSRPAPEAPSGVSHCIVAVRWLAVRIDLDPAQPSGPSGL